jgi:6-pyruvoyltetrahydropterin/6-carboxytetrahydropterin synthase
LAKFIIRISKEYLKFSSAHFTIFDDSSVERLHGHNYYAALDVECRESTNGIAIEFKPLKKIMESLCDDLDEKILLPTNSHYLKISKNQDQFDVEFHGAAFSKRYQFPCEDVELLPMPNVTSEMLAKYLCDEFRKRISSYWKENFKQDLEEVVVAATVTIEETKGQAVSYVWEY